MVCTLCYIESSESCHIASADDDVTEDNNNDVDAEAELGIRSQHNISQTGTKTGKYFYPLTCSKYFYHTDIMTLTSKVHVIILFLCLFSVSSCQEESSNQSKWMLLERKCNL